MKKQIIVGWVLSGVAILFLLMDTSFKFMNSPEVQQAIGPLGWTVEQMPTLGVILGLCTLLYAIPRTAPIGAIFLTGYLGGAIATHLRVSNPLFSHTLFPLYLALFIWGGLLLRNPKLRAELF